MDLHFKKDRYMWLIQIEPNGPFVSTYEPDLNGRPPRALQLSGVRIKPRNTSKAKPGPYAMFIRGGPFAFLALR
jgi:hypothetical protein